MTVPEARTGSPESGKWVGARLFDTCILYDPENPRALRRTVELRREKEKKWRRRGKEEECINFEEPVWPVWVPALDCETTIADFEKECADDSALARSTSKWLVTILGAALALLIGSAPLANLHDVNIPWYAYLYGGIGLAFVVLTLFLVIRVLIPRVPGFDDLTGKEPRFKELKKRLEGHSGVLLPIGITSLDELACRAQLESRTLSQLAGLLAEGKKPVASINKQECAAESLINKGKKHATLAAAQAGRAQWLEYLTQTITQWTVVASYEEVRKRAELARNLGLIAGAAGTALIVVAFLMPTAKTPAVNLATYRIAKDGVVAAAEQSRIGSTNCAEFKGVVVGHAAHDNVTVLVQPGAGCNAALITLPGKDLVQIAAS